MLIRSGFGRLTFAPAPVNLPNHPCLRFAVSSEALLDGASGFGLGMVTRPSLFERLWFEVTRKKIQETAEIYSQRVQPHGYTVGGSVCRPEEIVPNSTCNLLPSHVKLQRFSTKAGKACR